MPKGFVSFKEVKRSVSMVTLLVHYGLLEGLAKKGRNLAGPCPFCEGMATRQFQADPAKGAWYCFGCKRGGNVLDFVCLKERVDVQEAARLLDQWFGLGLLAGKPPESQAAPEAKSDPEDAPEDAKGPNRPLAFTLKTLDPAHPGLAPLGLPRETLAGLQAGYCAKGLLKGRLAVPVHDRAGSLLAYAGLALSDGAQPRTLFPPMFRPELEVFGLHLAGCEEDSSPTLLAADLFAALRLIEEGEPPVLALFDGSLSKAQEEALGEVLSPERTLILVGESFEERAVARLARLAPVLWIPSAPAAKGTPSPKEAA
jgi:DNA primase